ncbi:hypothetical protein SAMN05660860_00033 [Geoalkalibacter ferrihydriticus]|uniref:Uncharacterized protein n=2 Tax=Geoalkalibacter ferrihydriticus TaxID=392333 RepID=A0A0C2HMY0_9BACT|nr:hypothetical protein [Geoalkalibacter ferrihydriticus]KIH76325.1 hypothetical protein GFER_12040 [Geoalkalibacter ferrihydriticus DSM 17813]SDL20480.1 hypothetical protein SAMN05660860_00033 [Geoalkalibacter ferrihydriticus]
MKICKWLRYVAIPLLLLSVLVSTASGATRSGRFVTIDGQEVRFFRIEDRNLIKGWFNGTALEVPMDAVREIVFFDSPNASYSMFGNDISAGEMELTRKTDGQKFIIQDAFLPSDCDCTYLTYSYRNPFTDDINRGNFAIDGLRRIVFDDR